MAIKMLQQKPVLAASESEAQPRKEEQGSQGAFETQGELGAEPLRVGEQRRVMAEVSLSPRLVVRHVGNLKHLPPRPLCLPNVKREQKQPTR